VPVFRAARGAKGDHRARHLDRSYRAWKGHRPVVSAKNGVVLVAAGMPRFVGVGTVGLVMQALCKGGSRAGPLLGF